MTTAETEDDLRRKTLAENISRMEALGQRLSAALARRRQSDPALNGPASDVYIKALAAYFAEMLQNPAKLIEHQISYWGRTVQHYAEAQQALANGELRAPADLMPGLMSGDRRFQNALWNSHPFFNFVKQQYVMNADALTSALSDAALHDPIDRRRAEYFVQQIIDMISPTNFLGTNPDALQRAVDTDGESLVRGLENLVRDIEANDGELLVTLSDPAAFSVGGNIATAPGRVVYRNKMMELIQYAPSTDKVHRVPLVIFPPWINKYYILDLKPENSLIRWIVDQGFTLFVVSWVNPDRSYADTGLDDYIRDGFLRAITEVRRLTGEAQINAVGYCIAGTTLSLTLAHLQKAGDKSVRSASLFTTLTDFSDQGEFSVFLTDDFIDGIERQVGADGILSKLFMSRTFSFLRSNDLIYRPAIRSYLLGEAPPAFDLLFWNGDSTNLPGRMAMEYLRGLCQGDKFAKGEFPVFGQPVGPGEIRLPVFSVACETDHIAAWRSCFAGFSRFASRDKTFVLSESGHVAGIVNPPSRQKYGHWTSPASLGVGADDWKGRGEFHSGSWWPRWGAKKDDQAPGLYVRQVVKI
jgi:polyhydroxyalkanoate synthase